VGLLTFGNRAIIRWNLIRYSNAPSLIDAINSDAEFPAGMGRTNLYDGLYRMRTELFSPDHGARPEVPHIAIVITDGHATLNTHLTLPEARRCWQAGIQVMMLLLQGRFTLWGQFSGFYLSNLEFSRLSGLSPIFSSDDRPPFLEEPSWKNFKWSYLSNQLSDLLPVWFESGVVGTANLTVPFMFTPNWHPLPWQRNLGQNGP